MSYWFYMLENAQQGPVSEDELKAKLSSNEITSDTFVWKDGMAEWKAVKEISELNQSNQAEAAVPFSDSAVCEHCNSRYPKNEMMQYENSYICPTCKPKFVQKLKEGDNLGLGSYVYAGFWRRFVAIFIDGLIFTAIGAVFGGAIGAAGLQSNNPGLIILTGLANVLFSFIAPMIYEIYLIRTKGATLGKMAMGIKVISTNNQQISLGQSIGRYFAKMLSGIILCIGYLMVLFNDEKKALHDGICETRVVLA